MTLSLSRSLKGAVLALGFALALLPGSAGADSSAAVSLAEFSVASTPATVEAGEVTFTVDNAGGFGHELLVIRTDLDPGALPATDGEADESQLEVVGRIDTFAAGESRELTVDLAAGNYALICNIAFPGSTGHYGRGMFTTFTVGAAAQTTQVTPPAAGGAGIATSTAAGGTTGAAPLAALLAMAALGLAGGARVATARGQHRR